MVSSTHVPLAWKTNLFPTELFHLYCDFIKAISPFWYTEVSEHTCARFTHKQTLQLKVCKCGFTVSVLVNFCSISQHKTGQNSPNLTLSRMHSAAFFAPSQAGIYFENCNFLYFLFFFVISYATIIFQRLRSACKYSISFFQIVLKRMARGLACFGLPNLF